MDRLSKKIDSPEFKKIKRQMYRDYPDGFYIYCPRQKHKSTKDTVDYVTRYVGRPVMAQSSIIDYDYDMDHVIWWYEDHQTKETIYVHDSILSFMKKLIRHIPDEHFKIVRYIGGYATKKKKLTNMIKKMISKNHLKVLNEKCKYRQFRIDSTGIDPIMCSCGHEMEYIDSYFPGGLEEQINERWRFFDWRSECDPLQVY